MRPLVLSCLTVLVLSLSGCSGGSSSSAPVVERGEVEQEVTSQLTAATGREPSSVSCPDDLTGEVDRQMRCTLSDEETDSEVGVTLTVTSVEGDDVEFDIDVDDEVVP